MRLDEYSKLKSAYHSARIEGNDLTWEEVLKYHQEEKIKSLSPTTRKIYSIIIRHKPIKAIYIKKLIKNINSRTLRYHLKNLQDKGFIHKLGVTNGVYYTKTTS